MKPRAFTAKFANIPAHIKSGSQMLDALPQVAVAKISYQTPQIYTVNKAIASLVPANTGGPVPATVYGQTSRYAGTGGQGTQNGPAASATFYDVTGVAADAAGNIYVCDWGNNMIRKISADGTVSLLAGNINQGAADGQGAAASFFEPDGLIVDAAGNIFIGDQGNNLIRKITPQGLVTTFAGSGAAGTADGLKTAATFYNPRAMATDPAGNMYVADQQNNLIRKISPQGYVTTFAGSGALGFTDGTGSAATFNTPTGVGTDLAGNVYVADAGNNAIRKINPNGVVTTLAGNGNQGGADGKGAAATFNFPREIRADGTGNLYVTDSNNNMVRRISPDGVVTTITKQIFNNPIGETLDGKGNLYIANDFANSVQKIIISGYTIDKALPAGLTFDPATGTISGTPTATSPATNYVVTAWNGGGSNSTIVNIMVSDSVLPPVAVPNISYQTPQTYTINTSITPLAPANSGGAVPPGVYQQVTTFAGGRAPVTYDGTGTGAGFNFPSGIAFSSAGNLYISDYGSGAIRVITPAGVVTTIPNVNINTPSGLVVDSHGNIFVTSFQTNIVSKITPNGTVSVFAGSSAAASVDGTTTKASFNSPGGITIDAADNLYVADQQGNKIRKITPAGVVTTVAGSGATGATDGANNTAAFNNCDGVAVDSQGNIYVADTKNNVIRKIAASGGVTTFAGSGTVGSADGTGAAASFNYPTGLTIDASGNLYVADFRNNMVRKITPQGVVTTVAGSTTAGNVNGMGTAASFNAPLGIIADVLGNVYVTDAGNYLVREIALTGYVIDKPLPAGMNFDSATGIISGTPSVLSPPVNYTVTAHNSGGSSTTMVNIQVVDHALQPSVITFLPITPHTDQNGNIPGNATSTNNETPITYTSSDTTIAIILPGGLFHAIAPGTTIITASQSGNDNYTPATPVSQPLVLVEDQDIYFPAFIAAHLCDDDFASGAFTNNPLLPLTYNSSDPSVATITDAGFIHLISAGTTTITVSQYGNNLFSAAQPQSQLLTVTSTNLAVVTIVADKTSVCAGTPVTFTASVVNGINPNYQWQVNGVNAGTNSATFAPTNLMPADAVQCTATNTGSSCPASGTSNVITGIVTVPYTTPSIAIAPATLAAVCKGTNISFTATIVNGGTSPTYQWQVNGTNAGTNSAAFAGNTFADGDIVTCILTNNDTPCLTASTATSSSVKVNLVPASTLVPSVTITPQFTSSCIGTPVTYTATATDGGNSPAYQWQVNGQNAGANSVTFISSTLQTGDKITCTLTVTEQCAVVTATSNVANIEADPVVYYSVTIQSSVANNIATPGQQVTFTATATDTTEAVYQWEVNGVTAGTNSPVFVTNTLANGDNVACIVAVGGKCLATPFIESNVIDMIVYTPVVIPNTFTPNSDGVNDNWDIPSLAAYPGCSVSVFTRYGALIYNSIGYPKAWDGNYKGKQLPTGTYYYVIDLNKTGAKPLSGFVVIVR